MFHKPVCPKCHRELRPKKNGVVVLDMADFGPVEAWFADIWKCPKCRLEVVTGFGDRPFTVHYEKGFEERIKLYREKELVIENYTQVAV